MVTLALNVADPIVAGEYGKATFYAVGPFLLIGWAEVGPSFLQALGEFSTSTATRSAVAEEQLEELVREKQEASSVGSGTKRDEPAGRSRPHLPRKKRSSETLLGLAREADAAHRAVHQKPISADTLRVQLGIGATQARRLVKVVRSEFQTRTEGGQQLNSDQQDAQRSEPLAA
ncbi:hypothetical protein AB0E54_26830 [Amycolatopsis coloradensis]